MNKGDVVLSAQCGRGDWFTGPVSAWNRTGLTGQRFKVVIAPLPMTRDDLRDLVPTLWARMANDCEVKWSLPPPPGTAQVPLPSPEEFAAKCEKLAEPAQRLADAAKGVFRSTVSVPVSQPGFDIEIEVPPPSVHRLQTELADLRAKLRYATAIAPDGFRLVEGFVSATKGRETPNHTDRMAYIDGVKGCHVTDALAGPSGFIITSPCGVAFSGVVHIIERDPGRKYQPWPESLAFSVNA